MKTFTAKPADVEHKWIVIDAEGAIVGRLAAFIATRLRGKHRPDFTPHIDTGDHVIVINAEKVVFTGRKFANKRYYRHTGHRAASRKPRPAAFWRAVSPSAWSSRPLSACCPRKARWRAPSSPSCASMPAESIRTRRRPLKSSTSNP